MTYTATHHQGTIHRFGFIFGGELMLSIFMYSQWSHSQKKIKCVASCNISVTEETGQSAVAALVQYRQGFKNAILSLNQSLGSVYCRLREGHSMCSVDLCKEVQADKYVATFIISQMAL